MISHWTIENAAGLEQPLEAWGISSTTLRLTSLSADTLELTFKGRACDADIPFAFDSRVTLRAYDTEGTGRVWFIGRVNDEPREATGTTEGVSLSVAGLWEELEQTTFQQAWKINGGESQSLVSHVIVGQGLDDGNVNIAEGVGEVLDYASEECGIDIQLGGNVAAMNIVRSEMREQTCAAMLRFYLSWKPSYVSYFDYSTTPPTLHFVDRAAAPAITMPLAEPLESMQLKARRDLQVPVVVVKYLITAQIEGTTVKSTVVDQYPEGVPETTRRAVVMSFDLDGGSVSTTVQTQRIVIKPLPEVFTDAGQNDYTWKWWMRKVPALAKKYDDGNLYNFRIETPEFNYPWSEEGGETWTQTPAHYDNELVEGVWYDWMEHTSSPARHAIKGKVRARIYFDEMSETGALSSRAGWISAEFLSTNASTGNIKKVGESQVSPGQVPPTGVAQAYYESLAQLQYEGTFNDKRAEAGELIVRPGHVVNLTAGRAEWATMRAQVQAVALDLEAGSTSITVGPAKHLGLADLMRMMQPARLQNAPRNDRSTGKSKTEGNEVAGPQSVPGDTGTLVLDAEGATHAFKLHTKKDSGSNSWQGKLELNSHLFKSLKPNDNFAVTGLDQWFPLGTADMIWMTCTFTPSTGVLTGVNIDSLGMGNSFNTSAAAWSGGNGYCESDGASTNARHQTSRKLIAYTTAGANGAPVVHQVMFRDQVIRATNIDGRAAQYPFDSEGGRS